MKHGPLSGIRVLDLTRVLAGPYCTMILGDLGAEVIKLEAPGGSDDTRHWGPPFKKNESAYYLCINRNKKAITINLKEKEGRSILKQMIPEYDVIIHNFKYGTMKKWGLNYDALSEINEQLVYCNISGFGETGPYKERSGYDFMIQAMSGFMSITGSETSGPTKVGVAITDLITGLYANIAIQAALIERSTSGKGQAIDLALFDSAVSALANVASNFLISGNLPERLGNKHPNIAPYQTFQTKDGYIALAVGNDHQFKSLCESMDIPQIADDMRFNTNSNRIQHQAVLESLLSKRMIENVTETWIDRFTEKGIPCGPINHLANVFDDPQVIAREMVIKMNHPTEGDIPLVASPLKFSRTPVHYDAHPPRVGEHTDKLLHQLGISDRDINRLRENKII